MGQDEVSVSETGVLTASDVLWEAAVRQASVISRLAPQVEEDLAGEFSSGTPPQELATKYGVSRATVYRIAREHKVKTNSRRTFTPSGRGKSLTAGQIGTARQLQADGMSIRQIAQAVGSSQATVHRALTTDPTD